MAREPVTMEIMGSKVTSQPLRGVRAREKLPVVYEAITLGLKGIGPLFASAAATPAQISAALAKVDGAAGRRFLEIVNENAAVILESTVAIVDGQKYELVNDQHRDELFDSRPDLYLPIVLFAGRVTYQRFFPDSGLGVVVTPRPST